MDVHAPVLADVDVDLLQSWRDRADTVVVTQAAVAPAVPVAAAVPSYRQVLANVEFRALWLAHVGSVFGDQVTRVALAAVVLARTGSVSLSAASVAVTFLPWLLGAPVLGLLADRCPRRTVMVWCDVARAVLLAGMAVPLVPVPLLLVLAAVTSMLGSPFEAARAATIPEVLSEAEYPVGQALSAASLQSAQLVGFAGGGTLITLHAGAGALLVDAGTFLLSAGLLRWCCVWRPGAPAGARGARQWVNDSTEGARLVLRTPHLRSLLALACVVASVTVAPEGLAVAQAAAWHQPALVAGILCAVLALGTAVGVVVVGRVARPDDRLRLVRPLAVLASASLLVGLARPSVVLTVAAWLLAGVGGASVLAANLGFVAALDPAVRGRALSVGQLTLQVSQGAVLVGSGLLAAHFGPARAVGLTAAAALVLTALVGNPASSTSRSRLGRLPTSAPVYGWAMTVFSLAATLWWQVGRHAPVGHGPLRLPWWGLLPLIVAAQAGLVHFQVRRQAHSVSLCHLPVVLGLLCCTPGGFLVARVAGGAVAMALVRRQRGVKLVLNAACYTLEAAVAASAMWTLSGLPLPAALYAATLLADLSGFLVVAIAIGLFERRADLSRRLRPLAWLVPINLLATSVALLATAALWRGLGYLPLLVAVSGALLLSYRTFSRLRDEHQDLGRLHELASALPALVPDDEQLPRVAEQVRALLNADRVGLRLHGLSVTSCAGAGTESGPADGPAPGPVRVDRWGRRPTWVRLVGTAPYDAGQGTLTISATDRLGAVRRFDRDDQRLLHALTALVAGALDRGLDRQRLLDHARRDPLTGLWTLAEASRLAQDQQGGADAFDLVVLDVIGLGDVNDALGHDAGDALLQLLAQRLRDTTPAGTVLGRVGGGEVLVAVPHGSRAADQVLADAHGQATVGPATLEVRLRAGWCHADAASTVPQQLRRAQAALGAARRTGTRCRVWTPDLEVDGSRRLRLAGDLPVALRSGQVRPVFQPLCRAEDLLRTGAEALARWTHPELGPVGPDEFIAIAEQTGLIGELTTAVLDAALVQARLWRDSGTPLRVSVNLSPVSLVDAQLPLTVRTALARHQLPAGALLLEVTESGLMGDLRAATAVLQQLRDDGVMLAMDDFGTGHSSLAHLRAMPVDEVKIDRSFLRDIGTDPAAQTIVSTTVALCHDLGKTVVAEGVEDAETAELLRRLGVDVLQGFHLGRPLPADEWVEPAPQREMVPGQRAGGGPALPAVHPGTR